MKEAVIGIDIGGTFTKMGIVDKQGNMFAKGSIASDKTPSIDDFIMELFAAVEKMKAGLKEELSIIGIGIGAPNSNYYKGTIEDAANLKWKGVIPFTEKITKVFKLPSVLTNDANAAALGEMIFGGAKGMRDHDPAQQTHQAGENKGRHDRGGRPGDAPVGSLIRSRGLHCPGL